MPQKMDPPVNGPCVPFHNFDGYDFDRPASPLDRLNQGPFGIEQDEGWHTLMMTTPARGQVRNYGMGLVGYAWEEGGPPPVPGATVEDTVTRLARLPFCDKLYIRCDWRHVQTRAGRLDLDPIFPLALSLARDLGLAIGVRVQMSAPNPFPALAMPDFLAAKIPFVDIGPAPYDDQKRPYMEPAYHDPSFQKAFRELNELLAAEFDADPLVEWIDLMQYGFWGEGHTGKSLRNPFPDFPTALETFTAMTRLQIETWKNTALAVNLQTDISRAGNDAVIDLALRAGHWTRIDSIIMLESQSVEMLANRPPWTAAIVEDGGQRRYVMDDAVASVEEGCPRNEVAMLHALDAGATHYSLWQMADNLAAFHQRFPRGFDTLQANIGYRVRPSWIWRRKRYGRIELVVAFKNDGVAGVPGVLRVYVESPDGRVRVGGALDAGQPFAGRLRQASFLLPEGVDYDGLAIRAEIESFGVRRPVRWACEQAVGADGSLPIRLSRCTRAAWRKDV